MPNLIRLYNIAIPSNYATNLENAGDEYDVEVFPQEDGSFRVKGPETALRILIDDVTLGDEESIDDIMETMTEV